MIGMPFDSISITKHTHASSAQFENSVRTVEKTFFSESIAYEIVHHNENCSSDLKFGPEISAASNSTPRWKLFFLDPKYFSNS
jgi:hypothetical protein